MDSTSDCKVHKNMKLIKIKPTKMMPERSLSRPQIEILESMLGLKRLMSGFMFRGHTSSWVGVLMMRASPSPVSSGLHM